MKTSNVRPQFSAVYEADANAYLSFWGGGEISHVSTRISAKFVLGDGTPAERAIKLEETLLSFFNLVSEFEDHTFFSPADDVAFDNGESLNLVKPWVLGGWEPDMNLLELLAVLFKEDLSTAIIWSGDHAKVSELTSVTFNDRSYPRLSATV